MSSIISISDDDDSFDEMPSREKEFKNPNANIVISDDEDGKHLSKDLKNKRQALIKNLFPTSSAKLTDLDKSKMNNKPRHKRIIEGVEVILPVEPYSCQVVVMSKVISAMNKKANCLVESPTGTGKTLALLCAALAWQKREQDRLSESQAKDFAENYPQIKETNGAIDYIKSPLKNDLPSPEKFFSKRSFGEKSIYDEPKEDQTPTHSKVDKRVFNSSSDDYSESGSVTIHKKFRCNSIESNDSGTDENYQNFQLSPEKLIINKIPEKETPEKIRLPVIYYGARTHKQIQQVVKEFKRTVYCGDALMTILSSRDNSCIREFDRAQWPSKNDMCRGCIKTFKVPDKPGSSSRETNCKYYDNRKALNHKTLPPAFDLNELVETGERLMSCPYYAARDMVTAANIVFCPYNYLVDPGIRNSMQIHLQNNIVIIDEGHNIEDICRDTATFNFTKEEVRSAIKELNNVSTFRFANEAVISHIEYLLNALKSWEQWFDNQIPLINNQPVTDKEAVLPWEVENFVDTLNNHNVGRNQYNEFSKNVAEFCRKLRDDPRSLIGVTQSTGTLLESLDTVLGFLFRDSGKHMDDFKPVLVRKIRSNTNDIRSWRTSQFNKLVENESLTLRLICLNPAVIFEGLCEARCIILASGTLTPIITLKSELGTDFPITISPKHIVPEDRVWVGSLRAGPDGTELHCTSAGRRALAVQDALGLAVRAVCSRAPHGVLCFLPSYALVDTLVARWQSTGLWRELEKLKDVVIESNNAKDHDNNMERYYTSAESPCGALLLGVYRGKAAEGMDFKDRQARAVIAVGVPFPNKGDIAVKEKMKYNNKYSRERNLLGGDEWFRVQAYRALNQAVGRCVRHREDWGAVLLVDARFERPDYTHHLSAWLKRSLEKNHHSFQSLDGPGGLTAFLEKMSLEDINNSQ